MWADPVTLRVGEQLVGVRPDNERTAERIRTRFAEWLDPAVRAGEHGDAPVPAAISVRLDADPTGRGPRAVPQLRLGSSLLARSRRPDDIVDALDAVLGGVLARQADEHRWLRLRPFVVDDRAVLVDAGRPALLADPRLARAGITEVPTWSVAVDGDHIIVPAPLTTTVGSIESPEGALAGATSYRLVGLVALDPCGHAGGTGPTDGATREQHDAEHHPSTVGAVLARFASRHPSTEWFHTVEALVDAGRVHVGTDRALVAKQIRRLLVDVHVDVAAG